MLHAEVSHPVLAPKESLLGCEMSQGSAVAREQPRAECSLAVELQKEMIHCVSPKAAGGKSRK